jgi:hypothetical protein
MKKILLLFFLFLSPTCVMSQSTCTDPAGCSAVSFAASTNTVGVIEFGNSTGQVFARRTAQLCPESNCPQFYNNTTAITAPRTTAPGSKPSARGDLRVVVVVRSFSNIYLAAAYVNTIELLPDGFRPVTGGSKFSAFPFSKGFGNNSLAFLSPVSNITYKLVSNAFNPVTNSLSKPIIESPVYGMQQSSSVNRDGSLVVWVNRQNSTTVNMNFRSINQTTRRPNSPIETIPLNLITSPQLTKVISSISLSNNLATASSPSVRPAEKKETLALYKLLLLSGSNRKEGLFIVREQHGGADAGSFRPSVISPPIILVNFTNTTLSSNTLFQSVAIDPEARFVLYVQYSGSCQKNILKFLRINPQTGRKIGAPKILAGCPDLSGTNNSGAYGLDVFNLD